MPKAFEAPQSTADPDTRPSFSVGNGFVAHLTLPSAWRVVENSVADFGYDEGALVAIPESETRSVEQLATEISRKSSEARSGTTTRLIIVHVNPECGTSSEKGQKFFQGSDEPNLAPFTTTVDSKPITDHSGNALKTSSWHGGVGLGGSKCGMVYGGEFGLAPQTTTAELARLIFESIIFAPTPK
ncbi:hypothetical protein [Tsukamurella pseudospumae]|uniref:hypothetical protein n=1 Tax=Tsukamurella pseudospumae TaxID=239498 RepID=UPI001586D775|nr:hypothetical protein [Tsukamurella pseudospumae]